MLLNFPKVCNTEITDKCFEAIMRQGRFQPWKTPGEFCGAGNTSDVLCIKLLKFQMLVVTEVTEGLFFQRRATLLFGYV